MNRTLADVGIIGRADGPTAIYVTHVGMSYAVIAGIVLAATAAILLLGRMLHRDGG